MTERKNICNGKALSEEEKRMQRKSNEFERKER
jgi:hypothetical protein